MSRKKQNVLAIKENKEQMILIVIRWCHREKERDIQKKMVIAGKDLKEARITA